MVKFPKLPFLRSSGKGARQDKNRSKEGIRLLAALLVCYPEIESLSYSPERQEIQLNFMIRGKVSEKKRIALQPRYQEAFDAYNAMLGVKTGLWYWLVEDFGVCVRLRYGRPLQALSRGELEFLAEFLTDYFDDQLVCDAHSLDVLDPQFAEAQSSVLDQTLYRVQQLPPTDHLAGLREDERVVVYNRDMRIERKSEKQ